MSEAAANLEPQNNNEYQQAAVKLVQELLSSQSYAKLSEVDLRSGGLIANEESATDYISREMRFGESLQNEALEMFCNEAPPPIDTAEVNQWHDQEIFPRSEEDDVRLKYLGVREDVSSQFEHIKPEGLNRLVSGIVASAALFEWDNDSTADPEPYRKNIDTLMKLLDSEPEVLTLNGQHCWGIKLPKNPYDVSTGSILAAMMFPPSVSDYIVVVNPDRNSELSSLVFSDQELLGHMIKKKIRSVQSQARTQIDNTLRNVALEKYGEAKKKVNSLNDPARVGFFDRLSRDSENGEIELISIFRDRKDVEMFEGERPYNPDRVGSESGDHRFMVTKGENGELVFSWDGRETTWETVEKAGQRVRQMVQTPKKLSARVKSNGSRLEYAELADKEKPSEWSEEPDYKSENASTIHTLFRNIELITIPEWLEWGEKKIQPVIQMIQALNSCVSSIEYANKFRELGIAHYPNLEIIVNPRKRVNYLVDSTTPPPRSATSLN